MLITRSIKEPERKGLTWEQLWKAEDRGLINCWEVGRKLSIQTPDIAAKALKNELPILGWKGGVSTKLKIEHKYGCYNYLAEWQGLRGENLHIDTSIELVLICSKTSMSITFTNDFNKYKN